MIYRTDDLEFLDDTLMLRLNGPCTVAEFRGGITDPTVEFTPFSRECAKLWKCFHGSRFGHYNPKATAAAKLRRQQTLGPLRKATLGVLAAARIAVANARC